MSKPDTHLGINIDYTRDILFSESGYTRLKEGYMQEEETSPQQRFAFVSKTFSSNKEHAQRLYEYSSKMWLSYATPILSYGKTKKSLPVSCFSSALGDSMESILNTSSETRMLAVVGGGVGLHVGLRPGDKKSSGIIPHLKTYDVDTLAFKQGTTRRGATAAYLSISHPEIIEFLEMRKPTGGDPNRKCLNLHHGINITDKFMQKIEKLSLNDNLTKEEIKELDRWDLINDHTGEITETISARELWERILTVRHETGEPYIWFIDTANRDLPDFQKSLGLKNLGSNLCLRGNTNIDIMNDGLKETVLLSDFVEKFELGIYPNAKIKCNINSVEEYSTISFAGQTGTSTELIRIEDEDGNIIECTPDHLIYTKNRGYVKAGDLLENDELNTTYTMYQQYSATPMIKISRIKINIEPVYDITVPEASNFYANGILVHNCSEISLATKDNSDGTPARTFVCCLSSLNLEKWDEWKDNPLFINDVVEMLDNVISVFIKEGKKYSELSAAIYSAEQERSIGIGALGWHSLLQSKMFPVESASAVGLNKKIWSHIKQQAKDKTLELAKERGACPDSIKGKTENPLPRNAHLLALAPNASSSYILGTSPSCEVSRANVYLEKGVAGTKAHRNKYLEKLLESKGMNNSEVWGEIIANDGSVSTLDFMTDYEKDVFKTAMEVDQTWIIQLAADRQEYICQAQSTNLFFNPDVNVEYMHLVHLMAWQKGLKSLYYLRSDTNKKADKVGKKVERQRIDDLKEMAIKEASGEDTCTSCEG